MKKWFTVAEVLISVIVFGILIVALSKAYISVAWIYVRLNNQKILSKELLFMNQTIQIFSDNYELDYDKYNWNLSSTLWITWSLYLSATDWPEKIQIYQTWDAIWCNWNVSWNTTWSCRIEINRNNEIIPLLNQKLIKVTNLKFRITPFNDPYSVSFQKDKRWQPYATLFLDIQVKNYNELFYTQKVRYKIQEWFNFRYYEK